MDFSIHYLEKLIALESEKENYQQNIYPIELLLRREKSTKNA
jgi:hypothetical protein